MFDTTKLANGVHTIAWGVTDAAGNAEGIGSRYFTVLNGVVVIGDDDARPRAGLERNGSRDAPRAAAGSETGQPVASLDAIAASDVPSYAQRGFAMNAPLEILETNDAGAPTLKIEEVGVVRATVGAPVDDEGSYEGYLVKGGALGACRPARSSTQDRRVLLAARRRVRRHLRVRLHPEGERHARADPAVDRDRTAGTREGNAPALPHHPVTFSSRGSLARPRTRDNGARFDGCWADSTVARFAAVGQ